LLVSGKVLLDREMDTPIVEAVRVAFEADRDGITVNAPATVEVTACRAADCPHA
jgi:hypothetical protein